jgi:hypothetical protein
MSGAILLLPARRAALAVVLALLTSPPMRLTIKKP